jgi:hypothetical protein
MRNMRFCLLVLLFTFCLLQSALAKDIARFNIFLWGNKIGNLTASREVRPDGTVLYLLDTRSKAKVLWITRENVAHYEVVYKDGKLVSSSFKEVENGEVKRWSNINWDGKQYTVDATHGKKTFTESPTYSIVCVYFQNMEQVKQIFYEIEGDFNQLQHPEPGTCEFKSSDGNRNVYHFENGTVKNMEFHLSFATIKIERVN